MQPTTQERPATAPSGLSRRLRALRRWNLDRIKLFLVNREGMQQGEVDALEREYRRFIELNVVYPGRLIPVSRPVDAFWHTHILFTRDYADFCAAAIGRFLHHSPTVNEAERESMSGEYEANTLSLYRERFGDPSEALWASGSQLCSYGPHPDSNGDDGGGKGGKRSTSLWPVGAQLCGESDDGGWIDK